MDAIKWLGGAALVVGVVFGSGAALADKLKHSTAVFSGLDKITGRIISFEVAIDETVQFGSLQITPRVCYTRPATEAPQTDTFVEVDEVATNNEYKRIFSGWMYAASPGLHGIEHPVYDIWLNDCKGTSELVASPPETTTEAGAEPPLPDTAKPAPKPNTQAPRVRRATAPGDPTLPAPAPAAPAVVERRQPSQRFFPTSSEPGAGHDPSGGSK